jgi:hypothetical protein
MSATRSRHVFGSESNIDLALQDGVIDAFDILFITEGKIGWVDESGNKVILNGKQQVAVVNELPPIGDNEVIYICNSKMYFWDDNDYKIVSDNDGMSEAEIEDKISEMIASDLGSAFIEISDDEIDAIFTSYIS